MKAERNQVYLNCRGASSVRLQAQRVKKNLFHSTLDFMPLFLQHLWPFLRKKYPFLQHKCEEKAISSTFIYINATFMAISAKKCVPQLHFFRRNKEKKNPPLHPPLKKRKKNKKERKNKNHHHHLRACARERKKLFFCFGVIKTSESRAQSQARLSYAEAHPRFAVRQTRRTGAARATHFQPKIMRTFRLELYAVIICSPHQ